MYLFKTMKTGRRMMRCLSSLEREREGKQSALDGQTYRKRGTMMRLEMGRRVMVRAVMRDPP